MIFAVGEIMLLFVIIVLALVARWASKRETAREIAASRVYQLKLHGIEGPVTLDSPDYGARQSESANCHALRKSIDTDAADERVETPSA